MAVAVEAQSKRASTGTVAACLSIPAKVGSILSKEMQYRIFSIPLFDNAKALDELNHFLRANKIVDVKRDLVQN